MTKQLLGRKLNATTRIRIPGSLKCKSGFATLIFRFLGEGIIRYDQAGAGQEAEQDQPDLLLGQEASQEWLSFTHQGFT